MDDPELVMKMNTLTTVLIYDSETSTDMINLYVISKGVHVEFFILPIQSCSYQCEIHLSLSLSLIFLLFLADPVELQGNKYLYPLFSLDL